MYTHVENDHVAVVYSPGYGTGFSTEFPEIQKQLLFDPNIVRILLDGSEDREHRRERIVYYLIAMYPAHFLGSPRSWLEHLVAPLTIEWVQEGTRFMVSVHDGNENIIREEDLPLHEARKRI